jgi:hypothetical protein
MLQLSAFQEGLCSTQFGYKCSEVSDIWFCSQSYSTPKHFVLKYSNLVYRTMCNMNCSSNKSVIVNDLQRHIEKKQPLLCLVHYVKIFDQFLGGNQISYPIVVSCSVYHYQWMMGALWRIGDVSWTGTTFEHTTGGTQWKAASSVKTQIGGPATIYSFLHKMLSSWNLLGKE